MADALQRVMDGAPAMWTGLGRARQIGLLAVALVVPALAFGVAQWTSAPVYVPLFASLTPEDAGTIVAQLKAAKTPYRLGGAGEQVLVPADKVSEMRLRMATQGLPLGGGVGFEVFDKMSFGVSDFNQRVNYQRALQGELARTIGQLRGVARARVHLVMPQPALFAERERPPSASVFLKLAPGSRPSGEEVRGIVNLVASSVEGLTPARVTVVDTSGRVLAAGSEPGAGEMSPRRMEIKGAVEESLERRVQTLLDSALGPGQAMARVSAQLNFDQVERTEERFDPNPVTKQETRTVETSKSASGVPLVTPTPAPGPAGAAATASSAAVFPAASGAATSNEGTRESASVSYEVSKVVARTLTSPGEIQRLSVAVVLNGGARPAEGADKKDGKDAPARTAEDIEKVKRIVMSTVGYNQARGDDVTVVEMPFDTSWRDRGQAPTEADAPARAPIAWATRPVAMWGGGAAALVVGGALYMLRRRARRRRALAEVTRSLELQEARLTAGRAAGSDADGTTPAEELVRLEQEREGLRQKALGLASGEPEVAAQLIRNWMVNRKTLQPVGSGRDVA